MKKKCDVRDDKRDWGRRKMKAKGREREEMIMQFKIMLALKREESCSEIKERRKGTKINISLSSSSPALSLSLSHSSLPCSPAVSLCYVVIFIHDFLSECGATFLSFFFFFCQ